jgi:hypothetical protein
MIPSFVRLACLFAVLLTLARAQPAVSVPRFTHPGAGQTFYFVLTDRFANGSTANDTGGVPGGPDEHGFNPAKISHYHGGDFAGLTTRLDYLKNLGMTAVWLTPPLQNKPMQKGTAGYHGYWVTNFTRMDPHLGSNDEFRELVRQAHARGLKVFMDIITNHTADVIQYEGGVYDYVTKKAAPYRDATGRPFDEHAVAFNGVNDPAAFPALAAAREQRVLAGLHPRPPRPRPCAGPARFPPVRRSLQRGRQSRRAERILHRRPAHRHDHRLRLLRRRAPFRVPGRRQRRAR